MMNATIKQHSWTNILKFYGEQNSGRLTRLGVFEGADDYWLEDGMPLVGIDVDTHGEMPHVEIMLGDELTHTIKNARKLTIYFSLIDQEDGLDITDAEGRTTILRFEN